MYLNFSFGFILSYGNIHLRPCDVIIYIFAKFYNFWAILSHYLWYSAPSFTILHSILYLGMCRIWESFECLKFSGISNSQFTVVNYFHVILHFPKIVPLSNMTSCHILLFSAVLGLPIICENEGSKRLVQILVCKPTFAKLHMSKPL